MLGLHLLVQSGGSKLWRFRYRFSGKENMLALGSFPEVSLATARTKRDDAKNLLAVGIDPSAQRKLDKVAATVAAANTFGAITAEYLARLKEKGCSETTIAKNRWLLEDLAAPLKNRSISAITPAEILIILQKGRKDWKARECPPTARCHRTSISVRNRNTTRKGRSDVCASRGTLAAGRTAPSCYYRRGAARRVNDGGHVHYARHSS